MGFLIDHVESLIKKGIQSGSIEELKSLFLASLLHRKLFHGVDSRAHLKHWETLASFPSDYYNIDTLKKITGIYEEFVVPEKGQFVRQEPLEKLQDLIHLHARRTQESILEGIDASQNKLPLLENYIRTLTVIISVFNRVPGGDVYFQIWNSELDKQLATVYGSTPPPITDKITYH